MFSIISEFIHELLDSVLLKILLAYLIYILSKKLWPEKYVTPKGKAVLITGCDSGFGNRLAKRLIQMGFKVYATVLSADSPGAKELETNAIFDHKMIVLKMDVTNDREVNEVYERVKRDLQNSDHVLWSVVNNAGIATMGPIVWSTIDSFKKVFDVNVFGTVRVTRVFLPLIKASKGHIVNVGSIAGRFSAPLGGPYNMSKHSLVAFCDTLRREMFKFGIKVSSIEPGFFKTGLTSKEFMFKQMDGQLKQCSEELKQFYGSPEERVNYYSKIYDRLGLEDNIDIVVDDMIDAIINCRPKLVYSPMNFSSKIKTYVYLYFPPALIDYFFYAVERLLK